MFLTSPTTEKLDAALAKAQGAIEEAEMNCKNPFFHSVYADLTSVWRACRKALSSNGISVSQWPISSEDGRLHLVTRLAHDGQWIQAMFSTPVPKQDAQGYGSAITYLKRFTLCAAVGVVADSDDDGNEAVVSKGKAPPVSREAINRAKKSDGTMSVSDLAKAQNDINHEPQAFKEAKKQREENQKMFAPPGPGMPKGEPMDPVVTATEIFKPGDYVIEFGKYKGKMLKEIGKTAVMASLDWIKNGTDPKKPLAQSLAKFRDYGELYVQGPD